MYPLSYNWYEDRGWVLILISSWHFLSSLDVSGDVLVNGVATLKYISESFHIETTSKHDTERRKFKSKTNSL